MNHRARVHGKSKYGISRTIRVVLDLLTVKFLISYSTRPLQMFGWVGFGMGLFGAVDLRMAGVPEVRSATSHRRIVRCCCSASC